MSSFFTQTPQTFLEVTGEQLSYFMVHQITHGGQHTSPCFFRYEEMTAPKRLILDCDHSLAPRVVSALPKLPSPPDCWDIFVFYVYYLYNSSSMDLYLPPFPSHGLLICLQLSIRGPFTRFFLMSRREITLPFLPNRQYLKIDGRIQLILRKNWAA